MTFELDVDILPLDLHAKIQFYMYVCSARRMGRTEGHMDRQCQNYYTHNVTDMGYNKKQFVTPTSEVSDMMGVIVLALSVSVCMSVCVSVRPSHSHG